MPLIPVPPAGDPPPPPPVWTAGPADDGVPSKMKTKTKGGCPFTPDSSPEFEQEYPNPNPNPPNPGPNFSPRQISEISDGAEDSSTWTWTPIPQSGALFKPGFYARLAVLSDVFLLLC